MKAEEARERSSRRGEGADEAISVREPVRRRAAQVDGDTGRQLPARAAGRRQLPQYVSPERRAARAWGRRPDGALCAGTFPSLKSFGDAVWQRCVEARGLVRSLRGRLRRLPAAAARAPPAAAAQARRQALNFVVQGNPFSFRCTTELVAYRVLNARSAQARRPTCARWPWCRRRARCATARRSWCCRCTTSWCGTWTRATCRPRQVRPAGGPAGWRPTLTLASAAGSIQRAMEDCGRACGMAMALPVALRVGTDWAHMQPYTVSPATPEGQGLSSNLLS
ncbi:hypothetical protein HF086_006833 [Spodoptera exigua]|uniref:Uncharacterized protein n=1 Tax=Spodoptera exigua TaxID=7107 RepID=A0A922S8A6_SPOEX|nr:hypothetical protein HF086_006833 [Spodoptera exigua]